MLNKRDKNVVIRASLREVGEIDATARNQQVTRSQLLREAINLYVGWLNRRGPEVLTPQPTYSTGA